MNQLDDGENRAGIVYILEFSAPMCHARHYIGFAENERTLGKRLKQQMRGKGAKITRAAVARGITLNVVMLIPNCTRADERRLKNRGGASRAIAWGKKRGCGKWL